MNKMAANPLMITIGEYWLNGASPAGECFAKPARGNRSSRSPQSEALAVGLDDFDSRFDSPSRRRARRTDSFALRRPDGLLAVRGCGKEIDKVVSYLRQVAGVSSIARQEPTE
jgi:hypothetical protein